jgi:hypothetical protein
MRYKIKSPRGSDQYEHVLGLLRARNVVIASQNDHRRLLATEALSDDVRDELLKMGATVAEDVQYAPE